MNSKKSSWTCKNAEKLLRRKLHSYIVSGTGSLFSESESFQYLVRDCKSIEDGMQLHDQVIRSGVLLDTIVSSTLVNMYIDCGSLEDACRVFEHMHVRDGVSWNVVVAGFSKCGRHEEAIELFWEMRRAGVKPNRITYVSVLKSCTQFGSIEDGEAIHGLLRVESTSDTFLDSALVGLYARCGSLEKGRQVFDEMQERDVVSWNVMIGSYAQRGNVDETFSLFDEMQQQAVRPDKVTFGSLLKACTTSPSLNCGQEVHDQIVKWGMDVDADFFGGCLVDMYSKCRSIRDAQHVFDNLTNKDVVIYNVMIAGYAQVGHGNEAFKLLSEMQEVDHVQPDRVTFLSLLKACIVLSSLELGKRVHVHVLLHGYGLDVKVMNTVIDMYAKCGGMLQAGQVFDSLPKNNIVTWTVVIAGYVQHKKFEEAFKLFWQMQAVSLQPNEATYVTILKACAHVGSLEEGRLVHALIRKTGFQATITVHSALIDMYCKCGSVALAREVFDQVHKHDAISWTAMITGYAQHGHGKEALQLAKRMLAEGFKPDDITFMVILSACNHIGLVEDALSFFYCMTQDHGIVPAAEHYTCMVDLLGRAGLIDKVDDLLKKMPGQPNAMAWTASLGSCGLHGNMEFAMHASKCLHSVQPQSTAAFVLLSNMSAKSGINEGDDRQELGQQRIGDDRQELDSKE